MNKVSKKKQSRNIKVCTLCEKPHKAKTDMCPTCNKKAIELGKLFSSVKWKLSVNKLLWLKNKYNTREIFDLIESNPSIYFDGSTKNERQVFKVNVRSEYRSELYRKESYKKWESDIPDYILNEMKKHLHKEFIALSGEKLNPNVHYICKLCNEEQSQKYFDLKNGKAHDCKNSKSSGEVIIEDYLKSKCVIKTQYNTLKCINPITKRQLPYDIEIPKHKVIIEIQGQQHLEYIEYFHGSIENFYYQQRKDDYKKRYAEKHGYRVIYIYYDEIKSGEFKRKLNF